MASAIRKTNQSTHRIIEVIRVNREVSRRLISSETGLSTPSVTRLVNELVAAKILQVTESTMIEGSGPGRPASVVKIEPNCGCVIGVDVGEHVIQVSLGDMSGDVKVESQLPTDAELGNERTCDNIVRAIDEILSLHGSQHPESVPPLRAITIGVPGTIDPVSSRVVNAPLIKGWTDFDLKGELRSRLPNVALRIENDINAAAIGEYAFGVGHGSDNFVFASMRRGIGAGIFIEGKLYRGNSGFAGEMGKMVFDSNFEFSSSSGLGHLESICGEDSIVESTKQRGIDLHAGQSGRPTMTTLATAAANGSREANEVLESILDPFGLAIANIASLVDPSIVVLGAYGIQPVMEQATQRLNSIISKLVPSAPQVVGSSLGEQAILKGTLYQAHKDACDGLLIRRMSQESAASDESSSALANTASNIGSVKRPVNVFCWLG